MIYIDCQLNNALGLAQDLKKTMRRLWPKKDWEKLTQLVTYSQQQKNKESPNWIENVWQRVSNVYGARIREIEVIAIEGEPPVVA